MDSNVVIRNKKELHAERALYCAFSGLSKLDPNTGSMPWGTHALMAAALTGWDVVEGAWVEDYQGGCGYLLRRVADPAKWATLLWAYGTCSGCDAYGEKPCNEIIAMMQKEISEEMTEEAARKSFEDAVGRFW